MPDTEGTQQNSVCELIDMGAFYLAEFADSHCRPIEGSAVHGGIHVLQVVAPSLMSRLMHFAPLSQTFKVCMPRRPTCTLAPLPYCSVMEMKWHNHMSCTSRHCM